MSSEILQMAKDVPTVVLIAAVKDHPIIWDKHNERYKDKGARDAAWQEIIEAVLPHVDFEDAEERAAVVLSLTKRWTNIRDSYCKYNKTKNKKNRKTYVYAKELAFMDTIMNEPECDGRGEDDENSEFMQEPSITKQFNVSSIDLIRAIKKQPVIWNTALDNYGHKYARKDAWEKVYKAVVPGYDNMDGYNRRITGITVTKKWHNIRDGYIKNLKLRSRSRRTKPYLYEDEIKFLNIKYDTNNQNEGSDEEGTNFEDNSLFFEVDTELEEQEPSGTITINPLSTENVIPDDNAMTILMNLIEKAEDEDWAFFKSITPSVKSMSEDAKLEFRIEVMNLIKRLKQSDNDHGRKRMKIEID